MTIEILAENAGRRLDKFLFAYFNNASHFLIYKLLRKKRIKLNDTRAEGNEILSAGDVLRIFLSDETLADMRKDREIHVAKALTGIRYEDENILVVNKPAGLASHGGMKNDDSLLARVLYYLHKTDFTPALCNRLDVNTSGLVICGKSIHGLQAVNALFACGGIKKEYIAAVHGRPGNLRETHTLRGRYKKNPHTNTAEVFDKQVPESKEIITKFTVLEYMGDFSLVLLEPITGRSHQLRVHMAKIGHPLCGDKKYGSPPVSFAKHQLLHCSRLTITGESSLPYLKGMSFSAIDPSWVNQLQKRRG